MKDQSAASILKRRKWPRITAIILGVLIVVYSILGIYWSRMPDVFWVNRNINDSRVVVGYATTDTLIRVAETMLDKPGGYLSNDRFPPGLWLDNTPNWEFGALVQVRDLSRSMRESYSRKR